MESANATAHLVRLVLHHVILVERAWHLLWEQRNALWHHLAQQQQQQQQQQQ